METMPNNHTAIKKIFKTKEIIVFGHSQNQNGAYLFKIEKPKNQQFEGKVEQF